MSFCSSSTAGGAAAACVVLLAWNIFQHSVNPNVKLKCELKQSEVLPQYVTARVKG